MAVLGLTKLEALNKILTTINEPRVTVLPSGDSPVDTTSIIADAENWLDMENTRLQTYGWPENTDYDKEITPSGASFHINVDEGNLPTSTIAIWSADPDPNRVYVLRGSSVYDQKNKSYNFGSADTVKLDVVEELTFGALSPRLKNLVIQTTMMTFQRYKQGSQIVDQWLREERSWAELSANRQRDPRSIVGFQNVTAMLPEFSAASQESRR
jgi:hypothetical protein